MKKLLSMGLGLTLALSLAACSNDVKTEAEKPVDQEEPEKVVQEEVEEDRDYGGLTFTWAGHVLRDIDPEASEVKEKWYNKIKEMEEKWNFKFESKTIPGEDFLGNYIRTTLAGDPVGDVVYLNTPQFYPVLPENGIAYPISDLNVVDLDDPKWVQSARKASEYKGKTYSIRPGTTETIAARDGIFWNKTLFKNLGLPDLYELYENGEWTWDKLFEVAEAATKDLDNDGNLDVYGLAGYYLPWDFIYSNGAEAVLQTEDGIDMDLNDPKIVEALEYYQKIYKDKSNVFPPADVDYGGAFVDGKLAMFIYEWWIADWSFSQGKMKDEYGYLPFPSGPSHDDPENPVSFGITESLEIMLGTVDKPKEKLEIWDAITDIGDAEDWERWTREEYERGAGDAESVEYALLLHKNVKTNLIAGFSDISKMVNTLFKDIREGSVTVQSGLEAIDPQIQAAVAEFKSNGIELKYKTQEEVDAEAAEKAKEEEGKEEEEKE